MTRELTEYHKRVAEANRRAILAAATELFLEHGYDRTSLARVAARAGVSRATLFKQFPTKAELFEATVLAAGDAAPDAEVPVPPSGDLFAGLVTLGLAYVEVLTRPRAMRLIRTLIAESPHFPELRERDFAFGTLPVLTALRRYLEDEAAAGNARFEDVETVSALYAGMISGIVFWPRFVHGNWSLGEAETRLVVEEAARTIVSRFGT